MIYTEFREVVRVMVHDITQEEFNEILQKNGQSEIHWKDLWAAYKSGKIFWCFNGIEPKQIGEDIFNLSLIKVRQNENQEQT